MTISVERENEIRRLHHGEHWPVGTIASQLSLHEDTVKRVLGYLDRQQFLTQRKLLIEPYRQFIAQILKTYPRLRATRIYDMIRSRGFNGSVKTVRNYVHSVRPRPKQEAFFELELLKGEQAQIDWAHVGKVEVCGGKRSLWLFVMVLSWSRAMWGEFVFDTTVHSLLRSLARAVNYFAGCTRSWLFDNPKIVVLERVGDTARFHPSLLEISGHYHVQLKLCAVRKANQKGRVERAIRYLRDRFLAGRTILSIAQGNKELLEFIEQIALKRPHPTITGKTVQECLAQEKEVLLPLPKYPAATDQILAVKVDRYGFARFDTNRYSVPPNYVGETVSVCADDEKVKIFKQEKLLACHERSWGKKQRLEAKEHRQELIAQKQRIVASSSRLALQKVSSNIDQLFERWVQDGRHSNTLTIRTMKLLQLYGEEIFREAINQLTKQNLSDLSSLALLCEQERRKRQRPPPIDIEIGEHIVDREVIPHDLESYDDDDN